jgi:hypothetical protein
LFARLPLAAKLLQHPGLASGREFRKVRPDEARDVVIALVISGWRDAIGGSFDGASQFRQCLDR